MDAIDEIDDRQALVAVVSNHAIQSLGRNRPNNEGLSTVFRHAFGDLALLCREVLIPSSLVEIEGDPQSLGFIDQAKINRHPIIVFEMRDRSAYSPRPA